MGQGFEVWDSIILISIGIKNMDLNSSIEKSSTIRIRDHSATLELSSGWASLLLAEGLLCFPIDSKTEYNIQNDRLESWMRNKNEK